MEQVHQLVYKNKNWLMGDHKKKQKTEGNNRVCGHYPATNQLLLLSSFSCSSFTSFSTSHASSSSSSVWGVWSHSQKCLKLPSSSSSGAELSTSLRCGLSLPRLLRRWGGNFGGGGRGGTLVDALAGLGVSVAGHRLMVPPPSSSLCDWPSSFLCWGWCWEELRDLGWE